MRTPHVKSGGRYPVLRTIAIFYLIGAGVAALAALIGAAWSLVGVGNEWLPMGTAPNAMDRIVSAGLMLTGGFFAVITMLAVAEVLKLFIDVEHNTRMTALGAASSEVVGAPAVSSAGDGRKNRIDELDEETAEAALLRGH